MSVKDYWREAFMMAVEEIGLFRMCSNEDFDKGAECIAQSAENQSIAFGWDAIPSPVNAEIEALKKRHKQELDEAEKYAYAWKQAIASHLRIHPDDQPRLHLSNGSLAMSRS